MEVSRAERRAESSEEVDDREGEGGEGEGGMEVWDEGMRG